MTLGTNVPPPVSAAAAAAQHPENARHVAVWSRRYVLGLMPLLAMLMTAALVGAGAALLAARATGWGTETVVNRYISPNGAVSDHPADIKGLLAASLPSVVAVKATTTQANLLLDPNSGGRVMAQGTGVVIGSTGEVVTNAHLVTGVVSEASTVTVTFHDGSQRTARIVGSDCENDLALLQVNGVKNLPVLELADSGSTEPGDAVIAIGYALGLDGAPSVTTGIISATGRTSIANTGLGSTCRLTNLLQTDAPISSGDSGGPLIDSGGHVIGINTMVAAPTPQTTVNGISFAIPADTVKALLPGLRAGGAGG
ncbi:trypsin-like peptidase domain-containing protein [Pseudarthrobacter sp. PvP090]|uniref:S1C family serine protease n=1 Tax=Pseudarthrobacter sp. PvP090 TaxID=3156393 RepID=UPI0033953F88